MWSYRIVQANVWWHSLVNHLHALSVKLFVMQTYIIMYSQVVEDASILQLFTVPIHLCINVNIRWRLQQKMHLESLRSSIQQSELQKSYGLLRCYKTNKYTPYIVIQVTSEILKGTRAQNVWCVNIFLKYN